MRTALKPQGLRLQAHLAASTKDCDRRRYTDHASAEQIADSDSRNAPAWDQQKECAAGQAGNADRLPKKRLVLVRSEINGQRLDDINGQGRDQDHGENPRRNYAGRELREKPSQSDQAHLATPRG